MNTVFHIASLSKTFTAAAILILEQRGLLSTSDPLSRYFPSYPSGAEITIHHLLTHTSGITDVNDLPAYEQASLQPQTPESLIALFKDRPLEFRPEEKYMYTASNYNLLAFIVEQVSKMKYGAFLKESIFKPLGMNQTYHHGDMSEIIGKLAERYSADGKHNVRKSPYLDWSSKTGNGSIASTALDLAKWNVALFGTTLLSEQSKVKMFTNYVESGYGWYIGKQFGKKYEYMNGRTSGVCAHMGRYPEEELTFIVLSNVGVYTPKRIATDLAGILFKQPVETPALSRKLTAEELRLLSGSYQFGNDFYKPNLLLEVTTWEGKLVSNYGELIPDKGLQFFQRSYWLNVVFGKDASGRINRVTIDNYVGERVD